MKPETLPQRRQSRATRPGGSQKASKRTTAEVFISHASKNTAIAKRLTQDLAAEGFRIWFDEAAIQVGVLLGNELLTAIRSSRVMILLWSKYSATSRWVKTEWLTAFQLGRFIVPCVLDEVPLPQCLQSTVYLDLRKLRSKAAYGNMVSRLCRALSEAPNAPNQVAPLLRYESEHLKAVITSLVSGQEAITTLMAVDLPHSRQLQEALTSLMTSAEQEWPLDPMVLNLGAYHLKNSYLLKHWNAVQADSAPPDPLLTQAENAFFRTLSVDPTDMAALNGLGNIFFFERDLEAAEFFHEQALRRAEEKAITYDAAIHDLTMVRRFKGRP